MDLSAFMDEFRAESTEHVRILEQELLKLEKAPGDPQPVRRMFLSVHTIKGGAAMMELDQLRGLAHEMEDVLSALRDGQHALDVATADLLFRGTDLLEALVAGQNVLPTKIATVEEGLRGLLRPSAEPAAPPPPPAPPSATASIRARLGLVVDDSPTVRMIEAAVLKVAGYRADTTADGEEALRLLARTSYDLLVTGLETRGIGGLELAKLARKTGANRQVAIIVVTSSTTIADNERAAALGIAACLPKGPDGQKQLQELALKIRG